MIVRGGRVVTPEGVVAADLAVEDGRIAAIAPELPGKGEEIDARGLTVFPGLIDVHVHFNEPGRTEWEGAATGSSALAAGGGTLFFDMPLNSSPCTVGGAAFDAKRAALAKASYTDFALWGGIVPGNRDALEELADRGAIGFKAFMADSGLAEFPRSDDLTLYEGMRAAARLGLPVAVHAENHELVRPAGHTVRDYLNSRPVLAEVEAIRRAALLAGEAGAKLHIVHISSGRGVAEALEARARGVDLSIETCAHYLYFTEEDMVRLGAVAKCAPPLRPAVERDALCAALLRGEIDIVGSDHSPAPLSMKQDENFFHVWGGIAGVQSTLAVLLERSCKPARIAAVAAFNPAQRFGIVGKGRLAVGNDADFTLVDLGSRYTVTGDTLFQRHGLSPYIGASLPGVVRRTVLRGETVFAGGIVGEPRGRMVTRTHATTRIHA
ncbi:Allantoinase [Candidatus Sulfopaludibacter sp. SbA3]|nr:Allantoinase [Candidatus Sulfopaludibacter sp. SbA3]